MDLNATATPNPIPNTFPLPPPGLNYIAAIQPSIVFLMIGTAWSGILLPLLVAVFFFSTKDSRRKPIFIMNVVSIALGLIMGIYNGILEVSRLKNSRLWQSKIGHLRSTQYYRPCNHFRLPISWLLLFSPASLHG